MTAHSSRRALALCALTLVLCLAALPVRAAQSYGPPPQGPAGWEKDHGWVLGGSSAKGATAVLLLHGVDSSTLSFRAPSQASNLKGLAYDLKAQPKMRDGFGAEISPPAPPVNWFDGLGSTFAVATWTQVPCVATSKVKTAACQNQDSFDNAYQSAPWALRKLLDETTGPVALVGHSRGGLLVRRLLKEFGDAGGRIKYVVTLHTPHHGSGISGNAAKLEAGLTKAAHALPKHLEKPVQAFHESLADMLGAKGGLELGYHASNTIFPALEKGEKQLTTIAYKSYGGTSTIGTRLYIKAGGKVKTVDLLSLPTPGELHTGTGDLMVTDASAHFPWPGIPHVTQALHHGEVLWSQPTIESVRAFLKTGH